MGWACVYKYLGLWKFCNWNCGGGLLRVWRLTLALHTDEWRRPHLCLFWRGNLLYFLLRVLISSLSPLRQSEIHILHGLSSVFAFHGAPNYGPIQCLIYIYTHVPPTSCYWLALLFVQLLPARPCLICPC